MLVDLPLQLKKRKKNYCVIKAENIAENGKENGGFYNEILCNAATCAYK